MKRSFLPRLAHDQAGMAEWYPQFRLIVPPQGPIHWRGTLRPFRSVFRSFEVVVVYSPFYEVPTAWVTNPEISKRTHPYHPHLNASGSVCSYFIPDETFRPDRDDLSRFLDLIGDWLRRHIFWESAGWWPGAEAPHAAEAVLQDLRYKPEAVCVCGAGRRFTTCCRPNYVHLARTDQGRSRAVTREGAGGRPLIERLFAVARQTVGAKSHAELHPQLGAHPALLGLQPLYTLQDSAAGPNEPRLRGSW